MFGAAMFACPTPFSPWHEAHAAEELFAGQRLVRAVGPDAAHGRQRHDGKSRSDESVHVRMLQQRRTFAILPARRAAICHRVPNLPSDLLAASEAPIIPVRFLASHQGKVPQLGDVGIAFHSPTTGLALIRHRAERRRASTRTG